ncbi:hypothetical protein MIND_00503000 [Mycena indigotica]|uniref:Fungal-type protein kinase domain-containing protein n=1 Tax=Mycena indigotica TaxID=2126181 RepID=A0A8H6W6X5_9AGAR|nr:uncharacterized protein MIND_00503000 [Mycena indigotica]KAF7307097.1 hypothetical protein MIND_00503000 [Mycena indigotica]
MTNTWIQKSTDSSSDTNGGTVSNPPRTPPRPTKPHPALVTPSHASSATEEGNYDAVEEVQDIMHAELEGTWLEESDDTPLQSHLSSVFDSSNATSMNRRIRDWIKSYHGYDDEQERWHEVPSTKDESQLYKPLVAIFNAILALGGQDIESDEAGNVARMRKAVDTHRVYMPHTRPEAGTKLLKSEPDITIFASGGCITSANTIPTSPKYPYVGALWDGKLVPSLTNHVKGQIAVYAREVFIQQPNRKFVYVNVITPEVLRIVRFDRAGCYYTRCIDYHKNPVFFVKIVLLQTAFVEEHMGFDTSVYWENGQRKMKFLPDELYSLQTAKWEKNTLEIVLDLDEAPLFVRHSIRSRGTVCWGATYKGRRYVVKDYWRTDGRETESQLLKELTGVRGVGQMFGFHDDRDSIHISRGPGGSTSEIPIVDRWFMRIATLEYRETLEHALPQQLIQAIIDIAEGHRFSLLEKGILHRDISFANVRLSPYPGETAVIIDWDMAKRMSQLVTVLTDESGQREARKDRTGTRAYQSFKLLNGSNNTGHHDNMDDLESMFYVLVLVLFGYNAEGIIHDVDALPDFIEAWLNPRTSVTGLRNSKGEIIRSEIKYGATRFGPEYGPHFDVLANDLRQFFLRQVLLVDAAQSRFNYKPFPVFSIEAASVAYDEFLELARRTLDLLPLDPVEVNHSSISSLPTPKRRLGDTEAESPRARKKGTPVEGEDAQSKSSKLTKLCLQPSAGQEESDWE